MSTKYSKLQYQYSSPEVELSLKEEVVMLLAKWKPEWGTVDARKTAEFYMESFGKAVKISEITSILQELYWEETTEFLEEIEANKEVPCFYEQY